MTIIQRKSGSLWQYYRDWPFIDNNGAITDVPDNPDSASFKYKQDITGQRGNNGTKDVKIIVPLKYFSTFWWTREMSLINCEINIFLTWSEECIIVTGRDYVDGKAKFAITDTSSCNFISST